MKLELAQVASAWPLGASLAAIAAQGLYAGRRRTALNRALHEVRRPLQALALTAPAVGPGQEPAILGSVQMAATALAQLEREINGSGAAPERRPLLGRQLAGAAVARWQARTALSGRGLSLRWLAGGATVDGDRDQLAAALDNLIANAIDHGGGEILVEGRPASGGLEIAVTDSGSGSQPRARRRYSAQLIARLSGRRRHGHGLRVVRKTVAAHGGDFRLRCSERGTEAVLELPLGVRGRG
ncbi:MAG TPA: sensor histidine kinase [Solirubrobacterales bacterium]|jgi:signal transduction histidine kinase|nr:sensor histidine kinase [Solirubrobacterales bacterium]